MSNAKLEQCAELISGQHVMAEDVNEAEVGFPYLTGPADFPDGRVVITKFTEAGLKFCQRGDLLVTVKGSGVGKTAVADADYAISRQLMAVRAKRDQSQEFINFCLQSYFWELSRRAVGAIPGLSRDDLLSAPVLDCSSEEQQKIVEILSDCDTAINDCNDIIINLRRQLAGYREKLFKNEQFNDWHSIANVSNVIKSEPLKSIKNEKLLTVSLHCKGIKLNERNLGVISEKGRTYHRRHAGELLIGRQNIHNGGFGFVNESLDGGVASNAITSLSINENELDKSFLLHFLSRKNYYGRLEAVMGGTGQKEMSDIELMKLKIPNIPVIEQQKISHFLDCYLNVIDAVENQLTLLKQQKRGLMQQLLTGKLRVKGAA